MNYPNKSRFRTVDLTIGALFVVLMAIGANITVWLPFLKITFAGTTVPISLQTFVAILAGLLLGKKLGSFAMIVYLFVGAVGIPIYADMNAGISALFLSPTSGFLISFVFVAFFSGWIVEKFKESTYLSMMIAAFIGLIVNYLIGTPYLFFILNNVVEAPISFYGACMMMFPFFVKDFALTFVVSSLAKVIVSRVGVQRFSKVS
jgi:biotin transport system substrate-specific component